MMSSRDFLCLFSLLAGVFAASDAAAADKVIDDNFNRVQLERSTVAIEDHPEKNPWIFEGPKREIRCTDGILILGAAPGSGEVRMISKLKFKSGTLKTRIRLDKVGGGIHFYLGFLQRNPWHYRSAWVMFNESGNGHLYMTNGEHHLPREMVQKIRTGDLGEGKWHDLTIQLDKTGSELFVDGVSRGKLALPAAAPDREMNVVFIVNPGGKGSSMSIDHVTVTGEKDGSRKAPPAVKKVEIPVPENLRPAPGEADFSRPASASWSGGALKMENGAYRYVFDTAGGLTLKEIYSRFVRRNVISAPGAFFSVWLDGTRLPGASFRVDGVKISGDDRRKIVAVAVKNAEKGISGTVTFTVSADSPELLVHPVFRNDSSRKVLLGVCCPQVGGVQIGKDAAGDEFFFPMESGLAGKMECTLRQVYSMTLFMQLMSVWNQSEGGGLYAYTRDRTGYPKVMELLHRCDAKQPRSSYCVVPWTEFDQPIFGGEKGTSLGWRHLDFALTPGGETDIPEAVVGVHAGNWKSGLESYSAFVRTWFRKPYRTPKWYTEMYCCFSAHPHSGLWMFSSSPSKGYYDRKAGKYSYGKSITHLEKNAMQEIAFWWDLPAQYDLPTEELGRLGLPFINVHFEGDYEYHAGRGGLEALKKEIRLIHDKESRIILYTMPRGAAKGTKAYEIGRPWAQINAYGRPSTNYTGDDMGWNFCDMEQGFAGYYSKLLARRVAETDADGYRLDVLCRISPCYNPKHAHYDGTPRSTANAVMLGETLKKFKSELYKVSPEKIVTVEHAGSDYISQFHDGYFAENICWISESPMWADYRRLNAHMTVFTRFYFPEVKTWIHGASRSDEAVRMSLFNACGFACTSHKGIRSFRTLEENSDTFDNPEAKKPDIPTMAEKVFANHFPDERGGKPVWTVFNRSGKKQYELLEIDTVPGDFHYVEVYGDRKVSARSRRGKTVLNLPLGHDEVAVIVRFAKQLSAALEGDRLLVKVPDAKGMHCRVVFDADEFREKPVDLPFADGKLTCSVPASAKKIIIKLYSGKYLRDELIIER